MNIGAIYETSDTTALTGYCFEDLNKQKQNIRTSSAPTIHETPRCYELFLLDPNSIGDIINTVTDSGQKTSGSTAVLAFGTSEDDQKRAKKLVAGLAAAKKACH